MINARVESVAEKPAFRRAFSLRRCILPADGFYEWYQPEGHRHGQFLEGQEAALLHPSQPTAGGWRWPASTRSGVTRRRTATTRSAWLRTCSVITTQATDAAGHVHDRMPMVIRREAIDRWLDPGLTDSAAALDLLGVTEADQLEAYAVSMAVGNVEEQRSRRCSSRCPSTPTTSPRR